MAIYGDANYIGGLVEKKKQATDQITKILNREAATSQSDINKSILENLRVSAGNRQVARTSQQVASDRVAAAVAPQVSLIEVADQAAKAGSEEAKAIMDTFGKFADNSEDLALLMEAADADPEEITSQNAATFAARKAKELGLRSVSKMQAEAQQMGMRASLMRAGGVGTSVGSAMGYLSGNAQEKNMPTDADLIKTNGAMLQPPPVDEKSVISNQGINIQEVNGIPVNIDLFKSGVSNAKILSGPKMDANKILTAAEKHMNEKGVQDRVVTPASEAKSNFDIIDQAEMALQRMESQGKKTGIVQKFVGSAMNDPDIETLNKAEAALAMASRVPGTGAVSDFDARQLINQSISAAKSGEYNKNYIIAARARNKNALEYGRFYDWYTRSFGPNPSEIDRIWEKYRAENPLLTKGPNNTLVPAPTANLRWEDYLATGTSQSQNKPEINLSSPPDGIDPADWAELTDEEKRKFF